MLKIKIFLHIRFHVTFDVKIHSIKKRHVSNLLSRETFTNSINLHWQYHKMSKNIRNKIVNIQKPI